MVACDRYLPLALLSSVLGATLPCQAQQGTPQAGAPAAINPAAANTVLWLTPPDPELSNRLRGQLVDTSWQLVERAAGSRFHDGDRGAQLRVAFEEARIAGATAAAWVQEDAERIQVLVLDVAHSRLSMRDVPRQRGDSAQQSAAFETAALIVRATLASIESGTQVGEAVEEPSPSPVEVPSKPLPSQGEVPHDEAADTQEGIIVWLRIAGQLHVNSGSASFGPAAGAGVSIDHARLGLLGHFLLPHRQRANYVDSGVERTVELDLWQLGLALSAEYDWKVGSQWAVFLGGRPGLTVLHRATQPSATLQPGPAVTHWLPSMGVVAGLAGPALAGVLTPELVLGVQMFTRIPALRVGPTPQTELDWQLSRFEPWLGLGFRLP